MSNKEANVRHPFKPAWILHQRFLKDNKQLLYLLTDQGCKTVVKRISRSKKRSGKNNVQPFVKYTVSAAFGQPIATVHQMEAIAPSFSLQGYALYAGLYINEITFKLIQKYEPESQLINDYEKTLYTLNQLIDSAINDPRLAIALRAYERALINTLGFSIDWSNIDEKKCYAYDPYNNCAQSGFVEDERGIEGKMWIKLKEEDYLNPTIRQLGKQCHQSIIKAHLFPATLSSLSAFKKDKSKTS
jgi:DNA repair protein RecO (recombination protein O)